MDDSIKKSLLKIQTAENVKREVLEESKKIWSVALPSVISGLTSYGSVVLTQSFIGHTSSTDLAAYALVQTISLRFANGIVLGMSSATETLCGQAYGAKQDHMMGIFLQRSWLVALISATILLPFFLFATPIFKLLGQDEAIAESVGYISLWFIPLLYAIVFSSTIQSYLQTQQKNAIIAWLDSMQFIINIACSWLFMSVLDWGIQGALAALCISSWFTVLGEFVYIFGGWCPKTWKGFTWAALKGIFPVLKLSISSSLMSSFYLWYYSIMLLLAGYMKNAEVALSAFSICLNINQLEYMISGSLMASATVRVANELGRGDEKATKFSIKVLISTSVSIGVFFWILCLIFGNKLGYVFTNDEEVAQSVSNLSFLLAFSILLNGVYPVLSGAAVGAGMQTKVAIVYLISFYVIGVPIGAVLGFVFYLQVKGIWIGMITGLVVQTLTLSFWTWRTDWNEEISKTSQRLQKWFYSSSSSSDESMHISDYHA